MGKKSSKQAQSVALQLISLCKDNAAMMRQAEIVKAEFDKVESVGTIVSNQNQLMLNKVLHVTRAMDTGMKTFLGVFDALEGVQRSMGGYLTRLRQGKEGCFGRLNGDLSQRIQISVVDERNRFLHAAGTYPTKTETDKIIGNVESYLQTILNLT